MNMKYHFETAWKHCMGNIVPLLILTLVLAAVSIVSIGILAPVAFAGYTHSLFQLLKYNREPKAQDIFSQLTLFLPLFILTLIIIVISIIGFTLLIVPGILFLITVGYLSLYMFPILIDKQFGLIDSIKKSIAMVTTAPITDHLVVFVIFYALSLVGESSFIGFIALQPFATLFLLSVYEKVK